ncbi:hypothetical protein [Pandoraea sp. NPDC087047]|uniref:hypothetical protein n=1 Tax=Pandoraea sp. NPDC087047 TaxID=3364390 RepID=UPI0037F62B1B
MTIASTSVTVRQPRAARRVMQASRAALSALSALSTLAALLALCGAPALAQTTNPHTASQPAASAHAPVHRATAPRAASASGASATTAGADDRPVLPRLIAIATPEDDDIPRFALYAARDIEQLGLQFPAQADNASPDSEVVITMSLRDSATTRMRDFSRQHMNEPMTLVVDGVDMLTATIRSELGGKFQLQMPKEKARLLFQRVLAKAGPTT